MILNQYTKNKEITEVLMIFLQFGKKTELRTEIGQTVCFQKHY